MKLLVSLATGAMAQFTGNAADGEKNFSFSQNIDLNGIMADYGLEYYYGDSPQAGRPGSSVNDERYFFTATTLTTTTTTATTLPIISTGSSCWKCDAMDFVSCASEGRMETCRSGDLDCCFIEIRVTDKKLQQLCTGCKDERACIDNHVENFSGRFDNDDQCRPEMIQQRTFSRHGGTQSVCRQCFQTCDPEELGGAFCFGGIDQTVNPKVDAVTGNNLNGRFFTIPFTTSPDLIPVFVVEEPTPDFENAMGIPTGLLVDQSDGHSNAIRDEMFGANAVPSNVFFSVSHPSTGTNGKQPDASGTGSVWGRDDMTYWSLLAGDKAWWSSKLKPLQQRRDLQEDECTPPSTSAVLFDSCPGQTLSTAIGGSI